MAARKRGMAGNFDFNKYRDIPDSTPGVPPGQYDTTDEYELVNKTRTGSRALFSSGEDFGPYVLTQASRYYQGPKSSTRVAGHQFIPIDEDEAEKVLAGELGSQFYWSLRGYIYVRWWKSGSRGNLWRYGPCTLQDYRVFRESASKGRSVRALEAFGHGATTEAVAGSTLGI